MGGYEQPLTLHCNRDGLYVCSCGEVGLRGKCRHVKEIVEGVAGLVQSAADASAGAITSIRGF